MADINYRFRTACPTLPILMTATDDSLTNAAHESVAIDGGPVQLIDGFGRTHRSLRISVTDRCNIRCFYCMPAENVSFLPKQQILSFEEIHRLVALLATVGIQNLRLTGGEPLVRKDLPQLVQQLVAIPGIEDVALTTNGILLSEQASALRAAGLQRLNISLDTLREATFEKISRRQGLDRVLAGIDAALEAEFQEVRLNALAIRGIVEEEAVALVEFAAARNLTLRFIEFMPLDAERGWDAGQVLAGDDLLRLLEPTFGNATPVGRRTAAQPATDYLFPAGQRVGLIRPVTKIVGCRLCCGASTNGRCVTKGRFQQPQQVVPGKHLPGVPAPFRIERHELNKPQRQIPRRGELDQRDRLFLDNPANRQRIQANFLKLRLQRRIDAGQHSIKSLSAADFFKSRFAKCIKADVQTLQTGRSQRGSLLGQQNPIGRQRHIFDAGNGHKLLHQLRQVFPHQRFATGQPQILNTDRREEGDQPMNLFEREDLLFGQKRDVLRRHAVKAADVATVGDADAEAAVCPAKAVDQLHRSTIDGNRFVSSVG